MKKKTKRKPTNAELLARAEALMKKIKSFKKACDEMDDIIDQLVKKNFIENKDYILLDNFSDTNVNFRATSFRRFELRKKK